MGMFDDLIPQQAAGASGQEVAVGVFDDTQPQPNEVPNFAGGMFDDLIPQDDAMVGKPPSPADFGSNTEKQARFGDSLKPLFGGRNPVSETVDTFIEPLTDFSSDRSVGERLVDTAAFAASVPNAMLRLPTIGEAVEDTLGSSSLREAEESFVENNPKLLNALGALGEVSAAGNPLGQGFRVPVRPGTTKRKSQAHRHTENLSDDVARARQSADDMRSLNVEPFAPAVAMAKRGDNSAGALTKVLEQKPFFGAAIQKRARQFVDELGHAKDRIQKGFGSSTTMQGAGGQVRAALENVKVSRGTDVKSLDDTQLARLANLPPRLATYKDVQAAKYARAERFLPEDKAKAQPVGKGQERVIGGMENTRQILSDIKRRFGLTINKSEASRAKRSKGAVLGGSLQLNSADGFANPRWTGSRNVDVSLDAIASSKGNWRTGIEGMREIRSNIRRVLSSKADTEVNALSRGDLQRLYVAVSKDMDHLLSRLAKRSAENGDNSLSQRYLAAKEAYKEADNFTARYASKFEDVKTLFRVQSDEAVAGAIKTAMQDGTKGNLQRLTTLRRIVPKETIDEMASAIIVDLGKPTGRAAGATQDIAFSPSRFSSQWNSLSPQARKVMFGHRKELFDALNRFARVSQNVADYEALANSSRTGINNFVVGAGGLMAANHSLWYVAGAAGIVVASRGAAYFLSSPAYVNWLTRTNILLKRGDGKGVSQHLNALQKIVRNDQGLDPHTAQVLLVSLQEVANQ